ncbi:hypothetical protein HK097_007554, partial [Rhizophlyctis rosea]
LQDDLNEVMPKEPEEQADTVQKLVDVLEDACGWKTLYEIQTLTSHDPTLIQTDTKTLLPSIRPPSIPSDTLTSQISETKAPTTIDILPSIFPDPITEMFPPTSTPTPKSQKLFQNALSWLQNDITTSSTLLTTHSTPCDEILSEPDEDATIIPDSIPTSPPPRKHSLQTALLPTPIPMSTHTLRFFEKWKGIEREERGKNEERGTPKLDTLGGSRIDGSMVEEYFSQSFSQSQGVPVVVGKGKARKSGIGADRYSMGGFSQGQGGDRYSLGGGFGSQSQGQGSTDLGGRQSLGGLSQLSNISFEWGDDNSFGTTWDEGPSFSFSQSQGPSFSQSFSQDRSHMSLEGLLREDAERERVEAERIGDNQGVSFSQGASFSQASQNGGAGRESLGSQMSLSQVLRDGGYSFSGVGRDSLGGMSSLGGLSQGRSGVGGVKKVKRRKGF